MKRTVSAMQARQRLGELLEGVYYRGDEVVIERAGKVMAVVVPVQQYEVMAQSRERMFEIIERWQSNNRDVPFEEIQRDVELAIREARAIRAKGSGRRSRSA